MSIFTIKYTSISNKKRSQLRDLWNRNDLSIADKYTIYYTIVKEFIVRKLINYKYTSISINKKDQLRAGLWNRQYIPIAGNYTIYYP